MDIQTALERCEGEAYARRAANTARSYHQSWVKMRQYLATQKITLDQELVQLTPDVLIQAISWLSRQGLKKKTVVVYVAGITYFINWLIQQGWLDISQRDMLRMRMAREGYKRTASDTKERFPEKDAVGRMVAACLAAEYFSELERLRDIALIHFLASSGCRNNEARSTLCGKIDLVRRSAIVLTKEERERQILFDQATEEALRTYWAARGFSASKDAAFSRHDRAVSRDVQRLPITTATVRNVVEKIARLAGIDNFTPHYFRHAFAQKTLRDTGNMELVKTLLGHKSMQSTDIYAKIYPDDLDAAYREIFDKN